MKNYTKNNNKKLSFTKSILQKISLPKRETRTVLLAVFSFFFGQAIVFNFINPFMPSFLVLFIDGNPFVFLIITLTSIFGIYNSLSGIFLVKYLVCILLLLSLSLFLKLRNDTMNLKKKAFCAAIIILISGMIPSFYQGFYSFIFLNSIFESIIVFCLPFIFVRGLNMIKRDEKYFPIGNYEIISVSLIFSIIFVSSININFPIVNISTFLAFLLIMILSHTADSGKSAMAGLLLGFLPFISKSVSVYYPLTFAFCGVLSGAISDKNKLKNIIGIYISLLFTYFYIDKKIFTPDFIYSLAFATVVFYLLPDDWYIRLQSAFGFYDTTKDYKEKIATVTENRLLKFSNSMKKLSKSFSINDSKKDEYKIKELESIVESLASELCIDCAKKEYCWGSRFMFTYNNSLDILKEIEKNALDAATKTLATYCIVHEEFLMKSKFAMELYKNDNNWQSKILDNRELTGQQIFYISEILEDFSKEIAEEMTFNTQLENTIFDNLEKNNLPVEKVVVFENLKDRLEISIQMSKCIGQNKCREKIHKNISAITGKTFKFADYSNCSNKKHKCNLVLKEDTNFWLTYGVSSESKHNEVVNGDNYTVINLENGESIVALSDGMGSGASAKVESLEAIRLLEDFMDASFNKEIAIKLANSVLLQKNNKEKFATLDICSVNLHTGMGEFYKIGAVKTYILRKKNIYAIDSKSLPVGILENIDVEKTKKQFLDNDLVIMVTDGITDIGNSDVTKDKWLEDTIKKFSTYNPQDLANEIMKTAIKISGGISKDDMTVLVFRLNQKRHFLAS